MQLKCLQILLQEQEKTTTKNTQKQQFCKKKSRRKVLCADFIPFDSLQKGINTLWFSRKGYENPLVFQERV